MLCETHKDMLFKGATRLLALGGVALLATGATLARPTSSTPPLTLPKAGVGTALTSIAPPSRKHAAAGKAQPVARTTSAATPRATISLYEHTVDPSTLREQGCEA